MPSQNKNVDFWYRGGIKDVVFLKHECSARSQSVVKPTSDIIPTYMLDCTTSVNK